jgi:hypothetical protein
MSVGGQASIRSSQAKKLEAAGIDRGFDHIAREFVWGVPPVAAAPATRLA